MAQYPVLKKRREAVDRRVHRPASRTWHSPLILHQHTAPYSEPRWNHDAAEPKFGERYLIRAIGNALLFPNFEHTCSVLVKELCGSLRGEIKRSQIL